MVTVTERAKEKLKSLLGDEVDDPSVGFRLEGTSGQFAVFPIAPSLTIRSSSTKAWSCCWSIGRWPRVSAARRSTTRKIRPARVSWSRSESPRETHGHARRDRRRPARS